MLLNGDNNYKGYIVCIGAVMFQLPGITSAMLSIPVINQSRGKLKK